MKQSEIIKKIERLRALNNSSADEMADELQAQLDRKRAYNTNWVTERRKTWTKEEWDKHVERCKRWRKGENGQKFVERQKANARAAHTQIKQQAVDYKGGKCVDCCMVVPLAAFDFHHTGKKDGAISALMGDGAKFEELVQELDKCVLLCANCHRTRHNG